jgi:hypothetical protein
MVGVWSRENMKKAQSSFNKDIISLSQILLEFPGVDSIYEAHGFLQLPFDSLAFVFICLLLVFGIATFLGGDHG